MTRVGPASAALLALLLAGCASRLERSAALAAATTRERTPPPRFTGDASEFPRGHSTRLVLPGAVLRDAPPRPMVVYVPIAIPESGPPSYEYGPVGAYGDSSTAGYAVTYGSYFAPGGAVPPGLRPGYDPPHPAPSAAPYANAFPTGDVVTHRPGLSVGAGIFGRRD